MLKKKTGNAITDNLYDRFEFADLICSAMKRQAQIALLCVGPDDHSYVAMANWAGGYPEHPARSSFKSPFLASAKALELFWRGNQGGLMCTPVFELGQFSTNLMGGARLEQNIVGVSHWEQQHDLLLALIILYSFEYEVRLHHIGWRMESEQAMREASGREFKAGFDGVELPAEDHLRIYHWHYDYRSRNAGFHTEYQFFPDGDQTPAIHIDVAVGSPDHFLRFVAKGLGIKPNIWGDDAPNPYGAVWAIGDDQSKIGVMARDRWDLFVPKKKIDPVDAQRGPH